MLNVDIQLEDLLYLNEYMAIYPNSVIVKENYPIQRVLDKLFEHKIEIDIKEFIYV